MVLQLLFAEDALTQWQWYRSSSKQRSTAVAPPEGADSADDDKAGQHAGFKAIPGAVKRLYVPTQDDEKHVLRVHCRPASRWVITATPCTVMQTSPLLVPLVASALQPAQSCWYMSTMHVELMPYLPWTTLKSRYLRHIAHALVWSDFPFIY